MSDKQLEYDDFLKEVEPAYRDFVNQVHEYLINNDCKIKISHAKSGYAIAYSYNKRVILNYVFRKTGMIARIYGDNVKQYLDFMEILPEKMIEAIKKSSDCKRLIDSSLCNPKCSMGYAFRIAENDYQKCRFNSFMFQINSESIPYLKTFIEKEYVERSL